MIIRWYNFWNRMLHPINIYQKVRSLLRFNCRFLVTFDPVRLAWEI